MKAIPLVPFIESSTADFPPTLLSIARPGSQPPKILADCVVSWKRPKHIGHPYAKVAVFANEVSPGDVIQGSLGTCSLSRASDILRRTRRRRKPLCSISYSCHTLHSHFPTFVRVFDLPVRVQVTAICLHHSRLSLLVTCKASLIYRA